MLTAVTVHSFSWEREMSILPIYLGSSSAVNAVKLLAIIVGAYLPTYRLATQVV